MTKIFTSALVCTIALGAAGLIQAGERQRKLVSITEDQHGRLFASGHAGDVFNSQGRVETIFCRVTAGRDNYYQSMCFARDEKGRTLQCVNDEEEIPRFILGINGDSAIQFMASADKARCETVTITNGSYAAPKRQTIPEDQAEEIDTTGHFDEVQ